MAEHLSSAEHGIDNQSPIQKIIAHVQTAKTAWATEIGRGILIGNDPTPEQLLEIKNKAALGEGPQIKKAMSPDTSSEDKKTKVVRAVAQILGEDALKGKLPTREKLDQMLQFVKMEAFPMSGGTMTDVLDELGPGGPHEITRPELGAAIGALIVDDDTLEGLSFAQQELRQAITPALLRDAAFREQIGWMTAYINAKRVALAAVPPPPGSFEEQQRRYYQRAYQREEVAEAPQPVQLFAQAMRSKNAEDYGLESMDTMVELMTVEALSAEALRQQGGLEKALSIAIAALRDVELTAGQFSTISEVFKGKVLKEEIIAGDPDKDAKEKEQILSILDFIFYATMYAKAGEHCDKTHAKWRSFIEKYTAPGIETSPDPYHLQDEMIINAHRQDENGEYILPFLVQTTNMLNDPSVVYFLQRENGSKSPKQWLKSNVIDKLMAWRPGDPPVRIHFDGGETYNFPIDDAHLRGLTVEQVWLGYDFWQGAGFLNGWKNIPVEKNGTGQTATYRVAFEQAPNDIINPAYGTPYTTGFFGANAEEGYGGLRRISQFLQGIKQQVTPPRGEHNKPLRVAKQIAYENLKEYNKAGRDYMTWGEIAIRYRFDGHADTIAAAQDEMTNAAGNLLPFENRPSGIQYNLPPPRRGNNMSELIVALNQKDPTIPDARGEPRDRLPDALRVLWKKTAFLNDTVKVLVDTAIKGPQKSFAETAAMLIAPVMDEMSREPGRETRKIAQAERLVYDVLPVLAAMYVAAGETGQRIYKEEIEALFDLMKSKNLWYETNAPVGRFVSRLVGGAENVISAQGMNLRGTLAEYAERSARIKPNPDRKALSTADYLKQMTNIVTGVTKLK